MKQNLRPPKAARKVRKTKLSSKNSLVLFFQTQEFSPQKCLAQAQKYLSPIVTSLLFHGQPNARDLPSKVEAYLLQFLTWMQDPANVAGLEPSAPANINVDILILSRYLFRFLTASALIGETKKIPPGSMPFESLVEKQSTEFLTAHILDSFWASLNELPQQDRLVFQLFLEGLFPQEISHLLGEDLKNINDKIDTCRLLLGNKIYDEAA